MYNDVHKTYPEVFLVLYHNIKPKIKTKIKERVDFGEQNMWAHEKQHEYTKIRFGVCGGQRREI